MTKYVISVVVDVDDRNWSEQNDRDMSCAAEAVELLSNYDGADEVPYLSIRPALPGEKNTP